MPGSREEATDRKLRITTTGTSADGLVRWTVSAPSGAKGKDSEGDAQKLKEAARHELGLGGRP